MTADKPAPTFVPSFRMIAILKYLLYKCPDGRFAGLNQLAIDLGVCYKTILLEIDVLATHDFIDVVYSAKKKRGIPFKSFVVPSKNKLNELLYPLMIACEDTLIDITNLTNNFRAIENIKLDKRRKL